VAQNVAIKMWRELKGQALRFGGRKRCSSSIIVELALVSRGRWL